jgi:BirA family biotin operon repressor/biotin-[acetyl-CoA-carboxylase] ligase
LPAQRFACVIGFGVNCAAAPDGLPYPATSLAGSGIMGTSGDLLPRLSDAVSSNLELWRSGEGFSAIRSAWLAGANGLGHMLEARTNAGALLGVFETIDEHGRLVLATDAGRQTIEAGDIFPVMQSGVAADRT